MRFLGIVEWTKIYHSKNEKEQHFAFVSEWKVFHKSLNNMRNFTSF